MSREMFVYIDDLYLASKLGLRLEGSYATRPPDVDLFEHKLPLENCPSDLLVFDVKPLRTPGEALPNLVRKTGFEDKILPDIVTPQRYPIVTEKFKSVIEEVDPGVHDFVPCLTYAENGEQISDRQFYHFWIGRIAVYTGPESQREVKTTLPLSNSYSFVVASPAVTASLASLNIWTDTINCEPIYFRPEIMQALWDAGVSGLQPIRKAADRANPNTPYTETRTVGKILLD